MSDEGLDLDAGYWLSISEVARQKDKSRQAIAKRVDQLVEAGKLETRPGPNGTKLINLAQFDLAVGETGDAFKEMAAETVRESDPEMQSPAPVLRDAQTRSALYAADLKFLELEEKLGRVVPVGDAQDVANGVGEALVKAIDRLPSHAEMIAGAVNRDGAAGARGALKDIARELRQSCSAALTKLATMAAPSKIDPVGEQPD